MNRKYIIHKMFLFLWHLSDDLSLQNSQKTPVQRKAVNGHNIKSFLIVSAIVSLSL